MLFRSCTEKAGRALQDTITPPRRGRYAAKAARGRGGPLILPQLLRGQVRQHHCAGNAQRPAPATTPGLCPAAACYPRISTGSPAPAYGLPSAAGAPGQAGFMARVRHRHGPSSPCRPDQHRDAPPKNRGLNRWNEAVKTANSAALAATPTASATKQIAPRMPSAEIGRAHV